MTSKLFYVGAVLVTMLCGCGGGDDPPASSGAAAVVTLTSSNRFEPANVTIKAGQKVEWVWAGGQHDVKSGANCMADGKFDSAAVKAEGNFVHTFTTAGTYPYYCTPHCVVGMVGTVTVQ